MAHCRSYWSVARASFLSICGILGQYSSHLVPSDGTARISPCYLGVASKCTDQLYQTSHRLVGRGHSASLIWTSSTERSFTMSTTPLVRRWFVTRRISCSKPDFDNPCIVWVVALFNSGRCCLFHLMPVAKLIHIMWSFIHVLGLMTFYHCKVTHHVLGAN